MWFFTFSFDLKLSVDLGVGNGNLGYLPLCDPNLKLAVGNLI